MLYDIIISNGTVIDPYMGVHKKKNIYIYQDTIMDESDLKKDTKAKKIIDADGYYVIPGLIENHSHLYYGGSDPSIPADLIMIPGAVTSAIDQGSTGVATFENFYRHIVQNSFITMKAYLNVSNTGLITESYCENINPDYFDRELIKYIYHKYSDVIIGLKIRLCTESCGDMMLKPLEKAIDVAEEIGCPISVHIKDPNVPIPDIAKLLRKDDIWVHMYQLNGQTILNSDGEIYRELYDAKGRGVLFDVASGRGSFSFDMINRAFEQDFRPDLLGTDMVTFNMFERPLFSLLYTMSTYMNLGYSLDEVIKLCTVLPAKIMRMQGKLGTLKPGSKADIAVIGLKEKDIIFEDNHGGSIRGKYLLTPQMTVKNGKVLYRSIEF